MHRAAASLVALFLAIGVARAQNVEWKPDTLIALKGTVVTMDGNAEPQMGIVLVQNGKVKQVLAANAPLPAGAVLVDSKGFIYPGLMNMHDHIAYNYLKLYDLPKAYKNHDEWPNGSDYAREVNNPNVVVKKLTGYVAEAQKFAEIRAILGGTTTIQGADTQGGKENDTTLVRNVEKKNFGADRVGQNALGFDHRTHMAILDAEKDKAELKKINDELRATPAPSEARKTELKKAKEALEKKMAFNALPSLNNVDAFLLHLAEGIDEVARREFFDPRYDPSKPIVSQAQGRNVPGALQSGMVVPSLVGIHCTALKPEDFLAWRDRLVSMGATGVKARPKVIWSPVSNLLLYGKTTDIASALKANALVAIGTDWSPSGTKNLLWELKAIEQVNNKSNPRIFSSERQIVELATVNAALMVGWEGKVGKIVPNLFADLIVVDAVPGAKNAYHNLILAREENIQLTMVGGDPLAGDEALLRRFKTYGGKFRGEVIPNCPAGRSKAVDLLQDPTASTLTLAQVEERLKDALSLDPAKLAERVNMDKQDTIRKTVNDTLNKFYPVNPPRKPEDEVTAEDMARFMKKKYPDVRPITQLETFFTDAEWFSDIAGNIFWRQGTVNMDLRPYAGPTIHGMTTALPVNQPAVAGTDGQ